MADEFAFSVDSDWKKQAQEEKRRLAEEAQQKQASGAAQATPASSAGGTAAPAGGVSGSNMAAGAGAAASRAGAARGRRGRGELPEASFETLVQTMASQVLMYLGGVAVSNGEGIVDLDTAKHQLDLLAVLEEKTQGNLSAEEQSTLDVALYESRMRFTSVASRYIL